MSGVKKLAQCENDGVEQVTNENLKEEGIAGMDKNESYGEEK